MNEYATPEHALAYLARADRIPHRSEGEAVLLEEIPAGAGRFLDLGTGDGRLLALILARRPQARAVGLDFSQVMLEAARARFREDGRVEVVEHDLSRPLPSLGSFPVVVSCFAIHHLSHHRKRALYAEVHELLEPGGAFMNLEHVSSPTEALHRRFMEEIGGAEDPSNRLLDVETQLRWLREIGFDDVDCHWKWKELALLCGKKLGTATYFCQGQK